MVRGSPLALSAGDCNKMTAQGLQKHFNQLSPKLRRCSSLHLFTMPAPHRFAIPEENPAALLLQINKT